MLLRNLIFAGIAAVLVTSIAHAKMYRWVDENGTTVFSQSPPPEGISATEIKERKYPKPASPPGAEESPAEEKSPEELKAEKEEQKEQARRKAESDKIKAQNCKAAKNNLQVYKNAGNRVIKMPDGLYTRLTDEEREAKIKEEEKRIKEYCDE